MVQSVLQWLAGLPSVVLYLSLAAFAALENVFPPLPTDTVVAFGTWLAARGQGSALMAFACTWLGNVVGAAAMYEVGRRHGSAWMRRRFPRLADARGEARLRALYERYGIAALVVSRFIPGVRALVPPFAGALRVPAVPAIAAMAVASLVWYGLISWLAWRAGSDWDAVTALIARSGRIITVVASAIALIVALVWYRHQRQARLEP
ncbi:MAG TPA: DedA family protein [Gemmatimonadaceae bacterium]|nr:DedA family protein [Gemmatimonadaceae bacterium]